MARRKSTRGSKIQPAVMTLAFALPSGAAQSTIDLSQVASIVNRRFYRQGINWAVAGFKVVSPSGVTGSMSIAQLPNTWVMSNAWEKTFRAWQRQQRESLEDGQQESVRAKFNDFKIYADSAHLIAGVASNLLPVDFAGDPYAPGEWDMSQIVIPNFGTPGNNYEPFITAVGDDVGGAGGSISAVKAYANSRGVPQSPDPAVPGTVLSTANFLNLMFDVGDNNTDVLANVVGKNDDLPYIQYDYPGADVQAPTMQYHDSALISGTTIGGITQLKGGNFPCGLVRIASSLSGEDTLLQINLIPGNHRGYLCEPMTEM
jgi:hypothetical protein